MVRLCGSSRLKRPGSRENEPAPVLQDNARPVHGDGGAEMMEYAADERDRVPLPVDGRHIDRVRGSDRAQGSGRRLGLAEIDPLPGEPRVRLGKESGQRDRLELRIGDEGIPVAESGLLRLEEEVKVVRTVLAEARYVIAFQDVEHLQGSYALAVRRRLIDRVGAVIGGDGLHPRGRVVGEVFRGKEAAVA